MPMEGQEVNNSGACEASSRQALPRTGGSVRINVSPELTPARLSERQHDLAPPKIHN